MESKKLISSIYKFLLVNLLILSVLSCSSDEEKEKSNTSDVPELLYGKWLGADSRGQSLTFIINKDGTCFYQRETYVNEHGIYTYDTTEKKITTTIEEIGEGTVVYIIELLTVDKLVVKKAAYDKRITYTKDKNYIE